MEALEVTSASDLISCNLNVALAPRISTLCAPLLLAVSLPTITLPSSVVPLVTSNDSSVAWPVVVSVPNCDVPPVAVISP